MKRILITGASSYIGTSFENHLENFEGYEVDTVDMCDAGWIDKDFSSYDVVFHVAGIAHADTGKASDEIKEKYYKVNTELTVKTAEKAKKEGVGQFVFMSSIIVFGSKNEVITFDTVPKPDSFYGDSKLQADLKLEKLCSDSFKVASIRPPMIYGKGSKGNYPKLSKFACKFPIFPKFDNKRSMLYIENLCEFVRLIIENCENGYFYPQNRVYTNTSEMVGIIASCHNKKILFTNIFNPVLNMFKNNRIINKVFGSLTYSKDMSDYKNFSYCLYDLKESIEKTEERI